MNDLKPNWSEKEHLFPGIWVYRDVIKKELNIIDRIEDYIDKYNLQWQEAMVGYKQKIPEYRDCFDFKIRKIDESNKQEPTISLDKIWQDVYDVQLPAIKDYSRMYTIEMNYWEAMNFIKYGPGQHFQEHADHGFSYVCTLSSVAYINDDYEGGELYFPKLSLNIKPKSGDLYLFPSTYLFSHRAMPVTSGLKYSIVTMLDYNDTTHRPGINPGEYQ